MVRKCPSQPTNCAPCADGLPFANLSAEQSDRNLWLQVNFRRLPNPPQNNWSTTVCAAYCESSISQADADDCAKRMTFNCIVDDPPPNPNRTSWPTPTYCNQEMTCQNGADCYTIPAGSICEFSQIEANALAQSFCEDRVFDASLTSPCVVLPPGPQPPPPELFCPQESGSAAPESLEITSPQLWENYAVDRSGLSTLVSIHLGCNPTGRSIFVPPDPIDHPPGIYGLSYVTGFYQNEANFCVPPEPYSVDVHIRALENEEYNYDSFGDCGVNRLAAVFSTLPPGSGFNQGSGYGGCFVNAADGQSELTLYFQDVLYMALPYPPDAADAFFPHSNTGGNFRLLFDDNVMELTAVFPAGPMTFRAYQFEGLIPQPRKLAIENYGSLNFADDAAAASWDGTFPERTVYDSMSVQWAVTAAGAFGGAILKFVSTHPTSANGRGWQLDIFSAGLILMWRGFKAVGSTSIGRYYKHSPSTPSGPNCITCLDDSDDQWFP